MKNSIFVLLIIVFLSTVLGCQNNVEKQEVVIAVVNGRKISLKEFRQYYELDPNFGIDSTGYPALLDELNQYIDRRLAFEKAEKEGVTNDSLFKKARTWEEQQAMLRQLYREVVEKQVQISETELKKTYLENNILVHVRQLFSPDSSQINVWFHQILNGASFDSLAQLAFSDTLLSQNGGDLGWVKLGDLNEQFADAVKILGRNEISQPVRTRWGFHIIQLLDRKDQVLLGDDAFRRQIPKLRKQIKKRKSSEIARQFIASFMKTVNPQPVQSTFRLLWAALAWQKPEQKKLPATVLFDDKLIKTVNNKIGQYLNLPLIHMRNSEVSLGQYLTDLKAVPVSNRPRFQTPRQLSNKIGEYIRDKLLLERARKMGVQNNTRVHDEVRDFLEEQSYYHYVHKELENLKVPDWVNDYYRREDKNQITEHPHLTKFHTLQEWRWWAAEKNLHQRLRNVPADIQVDYNKLKLENSGIDWKNRIRMFAIRKPS